MRILDATASVKGMWYQKENPYTVFIDQRREQLIMPVTAGRHDLIYINPDIIAKWQFLPFKNESFDMVVFDPPHIIRSSETKWAPICMKYGRFDTHSWKEELRVGFSELFRVLKPEHQLILKWDECSKKIEEVLNLTQYNPLFGTKTGQKNKTHWICFLKENQNKDIFEYGIKGGANK